MKFLWLLCVFLFFFVEGEGKPSEQITASNSSALVEDEADDGADDGSTPESRDSVGEKSPAKYRGPLQYVFKEDKVDWWTAEQKCLGMGGHLATIDSLKRNNELFKKLTSEYDKGWIGLNDIEKEGEWNWVNTEPKFVKWGGRGTEPNGKGDENCVVLREDDEGWADYKCDYHKVNASLCGLGGDKYTLLNLEAPKNTWGDAERRCQDMNGHLVTIDSVEQNTKLLELMRQKKVGWAWIGLNDKDKEGNWNWVHVEPKWFNWGTNSGYPYDPESNGGRGENCVLLRKWDKSWADYGCQKKYSYFCEYKVSDEKVIM